MLVAEECCYCANGIKVKNTDTWNANGVYMGSITSIYCPLFSGEAEKKYVCPFCYGEGVTFCEKEIG